MDAAKEIATLFDDSLRVTAELVENIVRDWERKSASDKRIAMELALQASREASHFGMIDMPLAIKAFCLYIVAANPPLSIFDLARRTDKLGAVVRQEWVEYLQQNPGAEGIDIRDQANRCYFTLELTH